MPAAYDTYDYPSYWVGRDYEHKSEVIAIKDLIAKIHKLKTILEIGAGFGRLVPSYSYRAKKIILADPSSKLLKIARETFLKNKNFRFIHSSLENLPQKIRPGTIDLIILVRVLHHLDDLELAFGTIGRLLGSGGYLLLEFPNKRHWKATIKQIFKGNFTFPIDIFPLDIRSKKYLKKKTLPFLNFHPDKIEELLGEYGFKIVEVRSVSNMRSSWIKKILSTDVLLYIEKMLQKPLSYLYFGPSIFLLAQKRG